MAEEDTNDVTELKTKLRRQLKAINRKLERYAPRVAGRGTDSPATTTSDEDDAGNPFDLPFTDLRRFNREVRKRGKRWLKIQERDLRERLEELYYDVRRQELQRIDDKFPPGVASRATRERMMNLVNNNIERRIAIQLEKKKLDEWSEAKVMSMAKAECKKQLWDEYTEMKMEYMAQLEAQKMEKEREREERELKEKEKDKPRRKLRRASIAGMALDAFGRASMDGLEEYLDMIEEDLEGQDDEAAENEGEQESKDKQDKEETSRAEVGPEEGVMSEGQREAFVLHLRDQGDIAVQDFAAVKKLDLSRCNLSKRHIAQFAVLLPGLAGMEWLDLQGNDLGPHSISGLLEAIAANGDLPLNSLNLSSNLVGCSSKHGAEALRDFLAIESERERFKRFFLRSNFMANSCTKILVEGITGSSPLTELDLSENSIGTSGVRALCDMLDRGEQEDQGNRTLAALNLSYNNLGPDSVKLLGESLKRSRLLRLDLDWNPLGNAGFLEVMEVIPYTGILELNLTSTQVKSRAVRKLFRNWMNSDLSLMKLKTLHLSNSHLSRKSSKMIIALANEFDFKLVYQGASNVHAEKYDAAGIEVEELFEESESEESEAESEWRSGESEEGTDGDPAEGGAPA